MRVSQTLTIRLSLCSCCILHIYTQLCRNSARKMLMVMEGRWWEKVGKKRAIGRKKKLVEELQKKNIRKEGMKKGMVAVDKDGGVRHGRCKSGGVCAHTQRDGEGEWCWEALQSRWTLENERRMTKIEMLCCLCPYKDQLASAWPVYNTVMNWTTRLHYTVQFYNC